MITIKPNNKVFDGEKFNDFLKQTGALMPNEYIVFLKKNNGGTPEENIIELQNEEIKSFSVTDFFGIGMEEINDLKSQYETYKGRIPEGNIPICRVEGGNIVCLNNDNGSVCLWDHDTELIDQETLFIDPLIFVASSFGEFLELIKPYSYENNLDDYKVEDVWVDPDFFKGN